MSNDTVPKSAVVTLSSLDLSLARYTSKNLNLLINVAQSSSENDYLDELFGPQIPLPGDDYFVTIDSSDSGNRNCTHQNDSCGDALGRAPVFEHKTLVKVIILTLIAGFALVGNVATLSSIVVTRRQATSTVYTLLVQLAIADLLVATFCLLADAIWKVTVQWYGGNVLCKFVKFMQMFSLYLSTYVLVLIGFDRLSAVRFPMSRARSKNHIRNGIIFIWTISALFSSPQALIFSVMKGPFMEEFYQCVTFGFYTAAWQEQFYTTLSLILMFLLPLVILIVTYITTFTTIASQENMFSESLTRSPLEDARHKILHKAKIKTLMITVVIVLTFVVCWTPYYVTMVIFIFLEPDEELGENLQAFVFFFGSLTSMINPLIYGAFHLRRRKPRSSKSTTYVNNSSSSRVDLSLATFHRG